MHHNTDFIPYDAVSSVMIHTPLAGFSTITFYAYGRTICRDVPWRISTNSHRAPNRVLPCRF
ncbi:MAG: hypothetical protein K5846_04120 [Bacteroidales bacterium]|nr:hypothetical protein [Bacteroidales bacterium]